MHIHMQIYVCVCIFIGENDPYFVCICVYVYQYNVYMYAQCSTYINGGKEMNGIWSLVTQNVVTGVVPFYTIDPYFMNQATKLCGIQIYIYTRETRGRPRDAPRRVNLERLRSLLQHSTNTLTLVVKLLGIFIIIIISFQTYTLYNKATKNISKSSQQKQLHLKSALILATKIRSEFAKTITHTKKNQQQLPKYKLRR